MDGFFFGNTQYTDEYFEDVEDVRNYLKDKLIPQYNTLIDDEQIMFEINY